MHVHVCTCMHVPLFVCIRSVLNASEPDLYVSVLCNSWLAAASGTLPLIFLSAAAILPALIHPNDTLPGQTRLQSRSGLGSGTDPARSAPHQGRMIHPRVRSLSGLFPRSAQAKNTIRQARKFSVSMAQSTLGCDLMKIRAVVPIKRLAGWLYIEVTQ